MLPSNSFPTRSLVEWHLNGVRGPHPNLPGVTGKRVTIIIEKQFNFFENLIAKLFKSKVQLERPLDDLNSLFWELMDGSRNLSEIAILMDQTFHERIAPISERLQASLIQFMELNLVTLLESNFDQSWENGPSQDN